MGEMGEADGKTKICGFHQPSVRGCEAASHCAEEDCAGLKKGGTSFF